MGSPSIYVWDCNNAGIIVESFKNFAEQVIYTSDWLILTTLTSDWLILTTLTSDWLILITSDWLILTTLTYDWLVLTTLTPDSSTSGSMWSR